MKKTAVKTTEDADQLDRMADNAEQKSETYATLAKQYRRAAIEMRVRARSSAGK